MSLQEVKLSDPTTLKSYSMKKSRKKVYKYIKLDVIKLQAQMKEKMRDMMKETQNFPK